VPVRAGRIAVAGWVETCDTGPVSMATPLSPRRGSAPPQVLASQLQPNNGNEGRQGVIPLSPYMCGSMHGYWVRVPLQRGLSSPTAPTQSAAPARTGKCACTAIAASAGESLHRPEYAASYEIRQMPDAPVTMPTTAVKEGSAGNATRRGKGADDERDEH